MKKIKIIALAILVIASIGVSGLLGYKMHNDPVPDSNSEGSNNINIAYVRKKLEKISDLRTAKISYSCLATFEDGEIPIINKKKIIVYYEAEAYAGINVGEIVCNQDESGRFVIQLPAAVVYDSEINIKNKKYIQEKAIFNWTKIDDGDKIDEFLKKDFSNRRMYYELQDMADENAVSVIHGLLIGFLEEEQFEIKTSERKGVRLVSSPFSSEEKIESNKDEVVEEFKKAGFRNIQCDPIEKKSFDVFAKDGKVEKITIDGNDFFEKSDIYRDDVEVIITYQKKA